MKTLHDTITEGIFDVDMDSIIYTEWLKNNISKLSKRPINKVEINTKGEIEWPGDGIMLDIKSILPTPTDIAYLPAGYAIKIGEGWQEAI